MGMQGDPSVVPVTPSNRNAKLLAAIQIADVIRRNEIATQERTTLPANDPLLPLRTFLETPGVQQACMAAVMCVSLAIPTRRLILYRAEKHWRLGTIFPDLIVTPTLTVAVAQCALWTGSVYGSTDYLHRLTSIAAAAKTMPSPTLDAICTDPIVMAAAHWDGHNSTDTESFLGAWNPQAQAFMALESALRACRQRRDYNSVASFEMPETKMPAKWFS